MSDEEVPTTPVSCRVPPSLRVRIEAARARSGLSVSAYARRALTAAAAQDEQVSAEQQLAHAER